MVLENKFCVRERTEILTELAVEKYGIRKEDVHVGHVLLLAMLEEPDTVSQFDYSTGESETNKSVAKRTRRLASAMANYGLKPGDSVIIMGNNHLDLCIPYYACHFGGFSVCAVDPIIGQNDFSHIFPNVSPKMVFCQKSCEEKLKNTLAVTNMDVETVLFDEQEANIEAFINRYNGTHIDYRPPVFDATKITGWLVLTSGTTGLPKVAVIPFKTVKNAILNWWKLVSEKLESCLAMATLQWMSSLLYFISTPLKGYTRIQMSAPITPQSLVGVINKHKPVFTAWTPYLLGQFMAAAGNICDLACFKYITIAGSAMDKSLFDRFTAKYPDTVLLLLYGMTELLSPIFDIDENTPFGSSGKPQSQYEFQLIDDDGKLVEEFNKNGELWVRGDAFFKGYLNSPKETKTMLTDDGWLKTGDIFYRDEQNYYYFVERKRLLIKHFFKGSPDAKLHGFFQISPLLMEKIIKLHPGVADACVTSLPDSECLELPIAAVLRRNGATVDPQEIADLIRKNMEGKRVSFDLFFVDSLPITPSGKVNRVKVKETATTASRLRF